MAEHMSVDFLGVEYVVPSKANAGWRSHLASPFRNLRKPYRRDDSEAGTLSQKQTLQSSSSSDGSGEADLAPDIDLEAGKANLPELSAAKQLDNSNGSMPSVKPESRTDSSAGTTILKGVTGSVKPGEVLAILGPSGSGKTTFLNLLGGRSEYGLKRGSVLFGGEQRNPRTKRKVAYVMQDDVFFSSLTVRETLEFTAAIRIPVKEAELRERRIAEVVSRLRLDRCLDTRVGNQQFDKGISGGERKRLNIANELLAQPQVLLLDEPTSGLDASTAMAVVRLLRELANEGKTIITTIHQPSSAMFGLFDKILLLSEGETIFYGPRQDVKSYFEAVGYPFPPDFNPFDYLLQMVIDDLPAPAGSNATSARDYLSDAWKARGRNTLHSSHLGQVEDQARPALGTAVGNLERSAFGSRARRAVVKRYHDIAGKPDPSGMPQKYANNWFAQVRVLFLRAMRQKRGLVFQRVTMVRVLVVTVISSLFWFQIGGTEAQLEDRFGALFFYCAFWSFLAANAAIFTFPLEKAVLAKDRSSGAYRLSAYYVGKSLVELPADTIYPIFFCIVTYLAVGFSRGADKFFVYTGVFALVVLAAQSLGLALSAALLDIEYAQIIATLAVLSAMLFAGFYVDSDNIPVFLKPLRYLSFIAYGYAALARNELRGEVFECVGDDMPHTVFSDNGRICPVTAEAALRGAQLDDTLSVGWNAIILVGWIVLFRVVGYVSLKYLHSPNRRRGRNQ